MDTNKRDNEANKIGSVDRQNIFPINRRQWLSFTGALAGGSLFTTSSVAKTNSEGNDETFDRLIPISLNVEDGTNSLGIGDDQPKLSWNVASNGRSISQSAYRILVASDPQRLENDTGDLWDTGKVTSSTPRAEYDGDRLESGDRYYWKVRIWDDDDASAWSDHAWWEMGLLDPEDWSAEWIRAESHASLEFYFLRTEFELDSSKSIAQARAYASAGHQYELYVNGETVDRGPAYNYPDDQYYKTIDVTACLREQNAIGALYNWNAEGQYRPANEPGFIVQFVIEYEDGSETVVTTDGSWRVRQAPWQETEVRNGDLRDPIEVIDGRGFPDRWTEPGFNDDNWEDPEIVGTHPTSPWDQLLSQQTEIERHEIEPVSVTEVERSDGTTYVADFGEIIAAEPRVRFKEGESDHHVDMRAGYLLTDDGLVSAERGTQSTDLSYEYIQRDGEQIFEPFYYLGFRYFQVEDPGEPLDEEQVTAIARYNSVPDEHAATFSSSNDTLDEVWELARHSVLYGSQEQFIDTPTREKAQFLGDAFNISSTTMRAFGERRLTQKGLREFFRSQERFWEEEGRLNAVYPNGDGQRDIPDYTEKFPEWVWQYYLLTGDKELLSKAYSVVENVAEYVDRYIDSDTGLVRNLAGGGGPYLYGIVDWPDEMRYGYDRDPQAMTTVNVLGWNVFRRTAQIAGELNEPNSDVTQWNERAESLREAINDRFITDDGVYVDGLYDDGSQSSHASQHANAFPLAFGIVPDDAIGSVVDHVIDQNVAMGPMTIHRLLFGLDAVNEYESLLDVITNPEYDGWANILAHDGTFTWESWHSLELAGESDDNRSLSHPWGATVLVAIQRSFLGVQVTEPGASQVEIEPPSEALLMASGRVPTERGDVEVAWERTETAGKVRASDEYILNIRIPATVKATIHVPTLGERKVRVHENGKPIWNNGNRTRPEHPGIEGVSREDDRIIIEAASGEYDFKLEPCSNNS